MLNEDLYDAPMKTQIDMNILVEGTLTSAGLSNVLRNIFAEQQKRRVFSHHGGYATHIYIFAYTSRELAEAGLGQWAARLIWMESEGPLPRISISDL